MRNLLYGKLERGVFADPVLGELTATYRRRRRDAWCAWEGQHTPAGQPRPARVLVCGTGRGPDLHLLEQVRRVLQSLAAVGEKANRELEKRGEAPSFDAFELRTISFWDEVDEILQLEFVPRGANALKSELAFTWPGDDELRDHHVVLLAAPGA